MIETIQIKDRVSFSFEFNVSQGCKLKFMGIIALQFHCERHNAIADCFIFKLKESVTLNSYADNHLLFLTKNTEQILRTDGLVV